MSVGDRFLVMRMMFGGHVDRFDYHQAGLNHELLTVYLERVGFLDSKRVESLALFDDSSLLTVNGRLISLNMIATNPH